MKLTQKQQLLIDRYILSVGNELGDVPETTRQQAAGLVRATIWKHVRALDSEICQDAEILGVLQRLGSPAQQAEQFIEQRGVPSALRLSTADPAWLGVCGGIARHIGAPAWTIRAAALALGLTTGPVALIAYIGAYSLMYGNSLKQTPASEVPPVRIGRVLKNAAGVVVAVLPIHIVARTAIHFTPKIYSLLVPQKGFPDLGPWNWLAARLSFMLFLVLFVSVPWAVLSGLPMARQWDATAKRLAYATTALYAAAICLGLASLIVGLILRGIGDFGYVLP